MQKGTKIVLRKRIQDHAVIKGFEKLSNMKLPHPPQDIPVEENYKALVWSMDMKRTSSIDEYKKILELFELPFKTNGADRLYFRIKRLCWYDILFEVYEIEKIQKEL